jgi:large subunit ribosomal protein L13
MDLNKTFSIKPSEIQKKWLLIDADGVVLGRLASIIAKYLRGKHKPTYTPHMDMGDNVIVVNAEKVELTGKKRDDKIYYCYVPFKRMLPKGPLARQQLTNLRVYTGNSHPHDAQDPSPVNIKDMNFKNSKRN